MSLLRLGKRDKRCHHVSSYLGSSRCLSQTIQTDEAVVTMDTFGLLELLRTDPD